MSYESSLASRSRVKRVSRYLHASELPPETRVRSWGKQLTVGKPTPHIIPAVAGGKPLATVHRHLPAA